MRPILPLRIIDESAKVLVLTLSRFLIGWELRHIYLLQFRPKPKPCTHASQWSSNQQCYPCACRSLESQLRVTEQSQTQVDVQTELPSDTRQRLSQARPSRSGDKSYNTACDGPNKRYAIGRAY